MLSPVLRTIILRKPRYIGPGDILPGWYTWASPARAYNASYAVACGAAMDLQDQSGANPITINIHPTTGFADVVTLNAWVAAHTVTTIKVAKLYDQTGNGRHFTQATLASMPNLTVSGLNGLPVLNFPGSGFAVSTSATITLSQPFTYSAVYIRPGSANSGIFGANNAFAYLGAQSANTLKMQAGADANVTAADNAWHGVHAFFSGTSSLANVDGTETSVNPFTNGLSGSLLQFGRTNAIELTGSIAEGGMYSAAATNASQRGALFANQNSSYGYSGKL
jgi:hypothetical protein